MFKAGVFTSKAICTPRDLELEAAINNKLKQGRVSLFTMPDERGEYYGLTYSWRGLSKTMTRRTFDLDIDDVIEGLAITAHGMENAKLPPGYTYEEEDAAKFPQWVEDMLDA
jgi:hypothetical protein